DQVIGKLPLALRDLGEQRLKNMTKPVRVYCLDGDSQQHGTFVRRAQLPAKPSIAVLPFANHTGDADDEYLADGITDEIMLGLGRFHYLSARARRRRTRDATPTSAKSAKTSVSAMS